MHTVTDQWHLGILLILMASFLGALGDNLVRFSHVQATTHPTTKNNFIWLVGMLCTVVLNTVFTMWAFAYADSSLIVPFAGTHVIFAVLLAIVINQEYVSFRSWLILLFISTGILCTVIGGNKETINYSLDELMLLFRNPSSLLQQRAAFSPALHSL